ncbi:MAG: SusD/RagB family nutrient-binding outer membrane lipoprotein [Gemmatimonadetes bacterium]|nr:MAG: SusD/RagB family nutrient-binding outer membrane lipoprotein [Gemmatimonadota bacterium]
MRRIFTLVLVGSLSLTPACSDYLDVNTNPNGPQTVTANLYLPPMLHWMVTAPQFDGRFVGRYTQEWMLANNQTALSTWDRMGYDPSSDNGGEQWRDVYWSLGQNLIDMNNKATAEQRWDLLGVGLILKAWGWQALTDLHGEIIIKEAIDPSRTAFDYDPQDFAYQEVKRLLDSAIVLLQRNDGAVDAAYLAKGDHMYNGDRTKWLKLGYGMRALSLNHFSNKSTYDPAAVIADVDRSFASNADDALLAYPGQSTDNADRNFWGPSRGNINNYRQTQFIVNLMNGTQFGGTSDPRISRMLSPSPDGSFRGLDPNVVGFGALTATQQPNNFFGYPGTQGLNLPSRYLFADKSKVPLMTYSQLQFIKAEAALRMGDQATARTAYTNAISSHFDFVNARNTDDNQAVAQLSASDKANFLASPNIVPAVLTLSHIMSQKFIAQWAWGHNELWMDMRRYHYTDIDPVSGTQVFRGFVPPSNLYPDNSGKVVQRIRPRFNSEYVWNRASLDVIGGLATDYHTKPLWITLP